MQTTVSSLIRSSGLDRTDARVLLQYVLGVNRAWLVAHGDDVPDEASCNRFHTLAARRLAGEPVAYLVGEREFWGRPFQVTPDVLIPRPETELLIETALATLDVTAPLRVLDVGTGSGCIAITLALEAPAWQVSALDISPAALQIAARNARELGANVTLLESDMLDALRLQTPLPQFNLIVSNPPYIPAGDPHLDQGDLRFEPANALTDQQDGLSCYRHLATYAGALLAPNGYLLLEHGYDQGDSVPALLQQAGWQSVECLPDLAGQPRLTRARRPLD
ncbi:peptide chain release factor N(5)-glutamine methyltransferase [Leeia oryzae]|uniref:peptide chain release factor N(5)-glutamine methyltransferase n=1 Tax=Leeia oryzae TaxID=356662 RepID=UPI00035CC462|nr:peptide chain release factor N(5)-glutamine methyltransferase [Leeia oryzae]